MDKFHKDNLTLRNLYEPNLIENKWQTKWEKDKLYKTEDREIKKSFTLYQCSHILLEIYIWVMLGIM